MISRTPDLPAYGQTLKAIRKSLGLTQQDLQSETLSAANVALVEQGRFAPDSPNFREALQTLGLSLTDFNIVLSHPEVIADLPLIAQAELHLEAINPSAARSVLENCSRDTRQLLRSRLIETELDYISSNFVSADINLISIFDQMRNDLHFAFLERALLILGRTDDSQSSPIKSIIILSEFRSAYWDRLSSRQQALICAMLAARLSGIGDSVSALRVIEEFEAREIDVDNVSLARLKWAKSNVLLDLDQAADAISAIREAQELFGSELDAMTTLHMKSHELACFLTNDLDDDERLAKLIEEHAYLCETNRVVVQEPSRQYLEICKAFFESRRNQDDIALEIVQPILSTAVGGENRVFALEVAARCHKGLGDSALAVERLKELAVVIETFPPTMEILRAAKRAATVASELGEYELALALNMPNVEGIKLPLDGLF